MDLPTQPRLRPVEAFPIASPDGGREFVLRDPQGFAAPIALPYPAAVAASLMNGERNFAAIHEKFLQLTGMAITPPELIGLVQQLHQRYFLEGDRFRQAWKVTVETYLNEPTRRAAHAGGAYAADPEALRRQLATTFASPAGPGLPQSSSTPSGALKGVISPHIDLHRGGPVFAHAYRRIAEESVAEIFVILGTSHRPMRNLFCASKKHFDTPLGAAETDKEFVGKLNQRLQRGPTAESFHFPADELLHRSEHSIEFQTLFLKYLFETRRSIRIVPILVGSFHEFVRTDGSPLASPVVAAFVQALRALLAEYGDRVCMIAGVDLAHIGPQFGDAKLLAAADLAEQQADDERLLQRACQADAEGWFRHVAEQQDRRRVCGLSPTYILLSALQPQRGELLKYAQAAEPNGMACVSFASVAFY